MIEWILRLVYWFLLKTVRFEVTGREEILREIAAGKNPVFGLVHNSGLVAALHWDGVPAVILASRSRDGEIASRLLLWRGFEMVRGSSSKGGREALDLLRQQASLGKTIAITFDGPRGPALIPKPGVVACAAHAKGDLYFVHFIPLQHGLLRRSLVIRLNSWDRFLLPLPFARIRVTYERIEGQSSKDSEAWLTERLEQLESRARAVYGALYEGYQRGVK